MSEVVIKRCRTFRYRLHPNTRQTVALNRQLEFQRELYNAALEERIGAWKREGRAVSLYDQYKTLTGLKDVRPEVVSSGITLCRGTLARLDRAYASFFRRIRNGGTPGFPRFRSANRWDSIQWEDRSGWKITEDHRFRMLGVGDIKLNYYRPLLGVPKAITVKREGRKWWISVRCVDVPAQRLPSTGREVGIDFGIVNLVATSDGEMLAGHRFISVAKDQLAQAQRRLAHKQRGSNRRKRQVEVIAGLHRKVKNQRSNAAHHMSRKLVNEYDFIALEDLEISRMAKSPLSIPDLECPGNFLPNGKTLKSHLNRSINDAGWGILAVMISYKAESAGRIVVKVNPRHTSQRCAECGYTNSSNRVTQAAFSCRSCGHCDHADVNAARNIHWAGKAQQVRACTDSR
jgi:putative transposase